ncbi:Rabenosyn-5 [Geodia barretti]|nr:Rabenosyn-5 [Geodia barretti]
MQGIISNADDRKPPYLLMAESIIAGEHGYRLTVAMRTRQELIKQYEAIDSISKDIYSLGSDYESDPSASRAMFKLCRGIRVYASTYLQENLLSLPSLPTSHQLAEIRRRKEEEARERLKEMERQREILRQEELARNLTHSVTMTSGSAVDDVYDDDDRGFAGASTSYSLDLASGEKKKRFEKLKNFSNKVIPRVNFKKEGGGGGEEGSVRVERLASGSGWMSTSKAFGSIDSQDDPFTLQREQLLGYIQQARVAGRTDELAALEQSLREIERLMTERELPPQASLSYGFS